MDDCYNGVIELLDTLYDIIESQNEVIYRLSHITKKQATLLELLRNDNKYSDTELNEEIKLAKEAMEQYETKKNKLDDYKS